MSGESGLFRFETVFGVDGTRAAKLVQDLPETDDDGGYCPWCSGFGPSGGGYCEECGEGND